MSAVLDRPKTTETQKSVSEKQNVIGRVFLQNISWDTYEALLKDQAENTNLHISYNCGDLEIMVESYKHGNFSRYLEYIVLEIADFQELDLVPVGSTTFKEKEKKKGFEGDGSFYFKHAELVRAKDEIDLKVDPAPELVLEIDITHDSMSKFPIFAGLGVEEIWRFNGQKVLFYRLKNGKYEEVIESLCLKGIASEMVTDLLFSAQKLKRFEWVKLVRQKIQKA